MNKQELAKAIADQTGQSQAAAVDMVNAFIEIVQSTVASGDKVALVGFGVFEQTERSARTGRNPKTGEPIEIAASKAPKFVAGKVFKDLVASR